MRPSELCIALLSLSLAACGEKAAVRATRAKEIGVVSQPNITGRDGGTSAQLWGRSVWTFGDSVVATKDAEEQTWHHNSYAFASSVDLASGRLELTSPADEVGSPRYLVAPTQEEASFNAAHRGDNCEVKPCGARWAVWPGQPVWDEKRSRAIIPYGLIYAEPGDFNFHGVGQSFAVWSAFDSAPERPVVQPGAEHPTLLMGEKERGFGVGPWVEGDDFYIFSCEGDFDKPCVLAKVPLEAIFDRGAWRYWDGDGWTNKVKDAEELFDGSSILTVIRLPFANRLAAIYSSPLSNKVMLRTAKAITGPWSNEVKLFEADRKTSEGNVYDAIPHPELAEQDGRVQYVTFSRPNGNGWFGSELAIVRVELEGSE
jgi:hypothetical protein